MTRFLLLRLLLLVSLAFITIAIHARGAHAAGYDVHSCNAGVGGGANHSWAAAAEGGTTAYADCPAGQGLVARSIYDGSASGFLQGAYMIFDPPRGNFVDSINFDAGLRRPDCNWSVQMVAGNQDLGGNVIFGLPAGQLCDSQFQTQDEYTFFANRYGYAINRDRVRIEARCGAPSCTRNGVASIHLRNVVVRVRDDTAPTLASGRGALWTSNGWLGGAQSVGFDAGDSAGIQTAWATVDGQEVARKTNQCDFSYAAPCPQLALDKTVPTSALGGDGVHTLTLFATDAAGNTSSTSRTVAIDNTPPDPPQGLAVAGGEGWRAANEFAVRWKSSPPKVGAGVVGAGWELCPVAPTTSACTRGSADGVGITLLEHLSVPAPGAYTLKVWLIDAAGNQDSRLAAAPVTLRYDDASPSLAFEPPDPNDPTLVAITTSDRGSGVASGQIQMRRRGGGNWLTLPTALDAGRLVAHIDDERLGDGVFELQATATDAAGNQRTTSQRTDGTEQTVTLPLRLKTRLRSGVVVRHGRRARLARAAYARYGQLVRVRGRLTSPEGNPLQDVDVQAWTQVRDGVTPPRLIATVRTSRNGDFSFLVRKGPSRTIKVRYGGTAQIRPATKILSLNVRSRTTIRPSRRQLVNGESVRIRGRIKTGRIPENGKLVEVQVFIRGKWRTFATTRAGRRGTWGYDYRFDGTRGRQTYRFRARVPRETGYPFATGRSRVVRVRVRGV